jgi:CMP-N-acetylneuraminic acid synthetase
MKIYGLILVKSDSKRLPGKNSLMFHGKPMFLHNVDKCLGIFDRVYVSSDSEDILDWVDSRGAIAIKRPKELCGDVPNIPVYKHAVSFMGDVNAIVAVQANSPTIMPILIKEIKEAMIYYDEAMTVHPNGKIYGSIWGLSIKRLDKYKEVYDYYNPDPQYIVKDQSVDIHTSKDYYKALHQI